MPENTAENTLIAEATATDPDLDPLMLVLVDNGDIFKLGTNDDSHLLQKLHRQFPLWFIT